MKNSAVIRIVLFSVLAVFLIGLLIAGILLSWAPFYAYEHNTGSFVQNMDEDDWDDQMVGGNVSGSGAVVADQVSELEIQWVAGSITIVPGDTEQIEFSETGNDKKPMVWKQVGNKLLIQFSEDRHRVHFGFGFRDYSKDLTVTVPKNWTAHEVEINAVSANVDISDLTIGEVNLNSVSGVVALSNCVVESCSAETVSGDVKFSGSLGKLECDAVSADCTIVTDRVPREISLESVSGDIDLTLPENAGFTVDMDSISGDFDSDFAVTKQGRTYSYGDGSCKIDLSGMSGDITLRKLAP